MKMPKARASSPRSAYIRPSFHQASAGLGASPTTRLLVRGTIELPPCAGGTAAGGAMAGACCSGVGLSLGTSCACSNVAPRTRGAHRQNKRQLMRKKIGNIAELAEAERQSIGTQREQGGKGPRNTALRPPATFGGFVSVAPRWLHSGRQWRARLIAFGDQLMRYC